MSKSKVDFSIRLALKKDEILFYGPGVSNLLLLAKEMGSLRAASMKMNMSYSKAHRIVKEAEEIWGDKLIESCVGGAGGGFSKLTEEGEKLVSLFCLIEEDIKAYTASLIDKYFNKE